MKSLATEPNSKRVNRKWPRPKVAEGRYLFVNKAELRLVLNRCKKAKWRSNELRFYIALKLFNEQYPNSKKKLEYYLPKHTKNKLRKTAEKKVRRFLDRLKISDEDKDSRFRVKLYKESLNYILQAATFCSAILLLYFYYRRIQNQGRCRFTYSGVTKLTGIRSEAISCSIKKLERHGLLENAKGAHWTVWNHGNEYLDGPNLQNWKAAKIEVLESTVPLEQLAKTEVPERLKIRAFIAKSIQSQDKTEIPSGKNQVSLGKIEVPYKLYNMYSLTETKNGISHHEQFIEKSKDDLIDEQFLSDPKRVLCFYVRGLGKQPWLFRLDQRTQFLQVADKLLSELKNNGLEGYNNNTDLTDILLERWIGFVNHSLEHL